MSPPTQQPGHSINQLIIFETDLSTTPAVSTCTVSANGGSMSDDPVPACRGTDIRASNMEKFMISGLNSAGKMCNLRVPASKLYATVWVENNLKSEKSWQNLLIKRAVEQKKSESKLHIFPWIVTEDGKHESATNTLVDILNTHPYPLGQCPVVLPLATNTEAKKSIADHKPCSLIPAQRTRVVLIGS